jgi:hypothetical protein
MQSETFQEAKAANAHAIDQHEGVIREHSEVLAEGTVVHTKSDYSQSDLNDLFAAAGKE